MALVRATGGDDSVSWQRCRATRLERSAVCHRERITTQRLSCTASAPCPNAALLLKKRFIPSRGWSAHRADRRPRRCRRFVVKGGCHGSLTLRRGCRSSPNVGNQPVGHAVTVTLVPVEVVHQISFFIPEAPDEDTEQRKHEDKSPPRPQCRRETEKHQ